MVYYIVRRYRSDGYHKHPINGRAIEVGIDFPENERTVARPNKPIERRSKMTARNEQAAPLAY